ncbi:hypothetical protein GCM10020367_14650 [Streptomyces sannanensis]|uniref:Uncharacterized protein n=1 Tax=Streptomyces sannanensis TaxID=285536 RepID=A0ABP6S7R4_9ACTN
MARMSGGVRGGTGDPSLLLDCAPLSPWTRRALGAQRVNAGQGDEASWGSSPTPRGKKSLID